MIKDSFNATIDLLLDKFPEGKLEKLVKKYKKAALLTATLPVTAPLFYFADVWTLGTTAAAIYDFHSWWTRINIFNEPEQKAVAAAHVKLLPWFFSHPFSVGWAWLTKPTQTLSHPEVKHIWEWLNVLGIPVTWAALLSLTHYLRRDRKNNSKNVHGLKVVNNAAFGTSRWAGIKNLNKFCEFGPPVSLEQNADNDVKFPGGNLIGKLDGKIIRVNFDKMPDDTPKTAPHAVVYGGTGSGKSFSFVSGNIISAVSEGQSIIIIDPKGELFSTFAKWLEFVGYNIRVLNFMTPEHSHRWNIVTECMDDAEISEMVDTLSKNTVGFNPSYFQLKAMELMEALIGLLKGDFPTEQQHMRSLLTLAAWPLEKLDTRFKEAYKASKISPTIYERWRGVARENYDYAVSNLTAVLKNMTTDSLAALMSQQEIDLSEIGRKKTALFLIIPTGGEGVYLKPILSIFYKFLFKRLDKLAFISPGKVLPVRVRNIWDEMANVGIIPGLPEIISTARSKGIHIQMILQTPTQLEYVYGTEEAKTILGNCPTVMLIGIAPADRELARMFSEKLGNAAVEAYKVSQDMTVPVQHFFELKKRVKTVIERPLMTMDEILRIDSKDSIALLQWSYPVYLRKVGWTKLPQAKEIKNCGMLPVEQLIPARDFKISLPDIDGEEDVQVLDSHLLFLQKKFEPAPNDTNIDNTQAGAPTGKKNPIGTGAANTGQTSRPINSELNKTADNNQLEELIQDKEINLQTLQLSQKSTSTDMPHGELQSNNNKGTEKKPPIDNNIGLPESLYREATNSEITNKQQAAKENLTQQDLQEANSDW